jgi:hypothetical protein
LKPQFHPFSSANQTWSTHPGAPRKSTNLQDPDLSGPLFFPFQMSTMFHMFLNPFPFALAANEPRKQRSGSAKQPSPRKFGGKQRKNFKSQDPKRLPRLVKMHQHVAGSRMRRRRNLTRQQQVAGAIPQLHGIGPHRDRKGTI